MISGIPHHAPFDSSDVFQVVLTTVEPRGGNRLFGYDAYEYTAHSHTFLSDDVPSAKVTFDLSPIQVGAVVADLGNICYLRRLLRLG
jgi:hypothetical protein